MAEFTTKTQLLDAVRSERDLLEAVLARLTPEQFTQPGVEEEWTVKDVLAHIAYWEGVMVTWLETSLAGQTPDRPATGFTWDMIHELNAANYAAHKDLPLAEIMSKYQRSQALAWAALEAAPEAALLEPGYFAWAGQRPFLVWVEANTTEHYAEHRSDIEHWLAV